MKYWLSSLVQKTKQKSSKGSLSKDSFGPLHVNNKLRLMKLNNIS